MANRAENKMHSNYYIQSELNRRANMNRMDVILLEKVYVGGGKTRKGKLGDIGDKVSVKSGFARNFLLPQRRALRVTPENIAKVVAWKLANKPYMPII
mgnify:CR=1 FL=1